MRKVALFLLLSLVMNLKGQSSAQTAKDEKLKLTAKAELGFLAVADHKVQFSRSGTYFDYRAQGGQDVLFPVSRLSLELEVFKKNTFYLLYQPLRLETQVLLQEDLVVDDLIFPAGSSINLLYNFPFYRLSYTRELLSSNERFDLALGASLQLRNATISFESADGSRFRANRDLGPVPALKLVARANLSDRVFAELGPMVFTLLLATSMAAITKLPVPFWMPACAVA